MGIRRNYRRLSAAERDRFVQALHRVKSDGIVDQFANLHAENFHQGIHGTSHFLPWHREFLRRFEDELQRYDPEVTIPYWDSTVDQSPSDPLWDISFLGQFDFFWNLNRALGSDTLPASDQVRDNLDRTAYDTFWRELEDVIHNHPHMWVEGVMRGLASPGDPVFYMHHGWIDSLWVLWQLRYPAAQFVSSGTNFDVNDPLIGWPDRTPADVLDHYELGRTYDIEPVLQIEGQLSFLRAHDVGTAFGPPNDQLPVEVVVRLDNDSDRALGFQLRADGNEAARRGMLDALRIAFNDDRRVRLDYQRTGANNGVLLRVQNLS